MSSVLLVERLARLCTPYCCQYFFENPTPSAKALFEWLIQTMISSDDYGAQQSISQLLGILIGRDPGFEVSE